MIGKSLTASLTGIELPLCCTIAVVVVFFFVAVYN
jgi:hypothetical protein